MSAVEEKLVEALALPVKDRAFLAHHLLASLDSVVDADAEELWNREIDRRSREIADGSVPCVPVEEVIQSVDRK